MKPNEVHFEKCLSHSGCVLFFSSQHGKPRSASAAINLGHLFTRTHQTLRFSSGCSSGSAALPQLCVQTLPSRGWHCGSPWHGVTVALSSQAAFLPFCPLQTFLEIQGKQGMQNTAPGRTDLCSWGDPCQGEGSQKSWGTFLMEVFLLIYKAEVELARLIWFSMSLAKGKKQQSKIILKEELEK